jgi:hypothetical protein
VTACIDDCGLVIDDWSAANPETGALQTLRPALLGTLNHQSEIINQQFPVE